MALSVFLVLARAAGVDDPVPDARLAAELIRCRSISEVTARLTCYDAINPAKATATVVVPAATSQPVARPAGQASSPQSRFGLEHQPSGDTDELRSSIPGPFSGWEAKTRFRLANGQLWQIADGSRAYYRLDSPTVRITRGAFGNFFMEVTGVSHAVSVRRLE